MKEESKFRKNRVDPFLKTLQNTFSISIQQTAIRGDADKILCCNGFFVWLELKTDVGEPSPLQQWKYSNVQKAQGIAIIARPRNWEKVKTFLQLLDRGIYDRNALRGIEQH